MTYTTDKNKNITGFTADVTPHYYLNNSPKTMSDSPLDAPSITPPIKIWIHKTKITMDDSQGSRPPKAKHSQRFQLAKSVLGPVIASYIEKAIAKANIEQLEDGTYYAEISELPGIWINAKSSEDAKRSLAGVVEGWLELKIEDLDNDIPVLDHIDLNAILSYLEPKPEAS